MDVYYPCKEFSVHESMLLWSDLLYFRQKNKYGINFFMLMGRTTPILQIHDPSEGISRKVGHGEMTSRYSPSRICVVKWRDKREDLVISSWFGVDLKTEKVRLGDVK